MGRIVFWLLAALAAYLGYRWWRIRQHTEAVRDASARDKVESMVCCEVCGLNLPQSEALEAGGHWYCGEEHRRAGPSKREA
ncbi:MAG: PP0621 family protein [Gemmatimonadota bacterium]